METARSSVADKCADVRGSVAVGVIPTIAPYLMPRYTTVFAKKCPEAKLRIVEETTPILVESPRDLSIDLAILALPLRHKDLELFPLRTEPLFAVLPKNHPLAAAIASGTSASPPALVLASRRASLSRAASSAASLEWLPLASASHSSPKWPEIGMPAAAMCALVTRAQLAPSSPPFCADAVSTVSSRPFGQGSQISAAGQFTKALEGYISIRSIREDYAVYRSWPA